MALTPELILKSCNCFTAYMNDKSWDDDIMWLAYTILGSIEDANFKAKVIAKLSIYNEHQHIGPLALYFMLYKIAYCDTTMLNNLISGLMQLKKSIFSNEDMSQHASVWLRMMIFLKLQ